jgi:hypothetical protein
MLLPSPKPRLFPPRPTPGPKPKRLPKGKPMTFAVGMRSFDGLLIAADTQITYSDSTTDHVCKLRAGITGSASYALAHASDDANAGESLMASVADAVDARDPETLTDIESAVKGAMITWVSSYFAGNFPSISLIVGAFVKGNSAGEPKDMALYLCEPPTTVVRKTNENTGAYVSVGAGKSVADPLYRILFARPAGSRIRLAQISYLMYRAKKDCGGAVGGETDAVFLPFEHKEPSWVREESMADAEYRGRFIDEALACTAATVMPDIDSDDTKELLKFLEQIDFKRAGFRHFDFQILGGGTISD